MTTKTLYYYEGNQNLSGIPVRIKLPFSNTKKEADNILIDFLSKNYSSHFTISDFKIFSIALPIEDTFDSIWKVLGVLENYLASEEYNAYNLKSEIQNAIECFKQKNMPLSLRQLSGCYLFRVASTISNLQALGKSTNNLRVNPFITEMREREMDYTSLSLYNNYYANGSDNVKLEFLLERINQAIFEYDYDNLYRRDSHIC